MEFLYSPGVEDGTKNRRVGGFKDLFKHFNKGSRNSWEIQRQKLGSWQGQSRERLFAPISVADFWPAGRETSLRKRAKE
jgi:hypothetical protein